jgi:hypothetical protein
MPCPKIYFHRKDGDCLFSSFESRIRGKYKEGFYPSGPGSSHIETNRLIQDLNEHLKHFMENAGFELSIHRNL